MKCTQPILASLSIALLFLFVCDFAYMRLSINIQPTRGGVAPLYNAVGPSFLIVLNKQSKGPLNRPSDLLVVCIRILTVSFKDKLYQLYMQP